MAGISVGFLSLLYHLGLEEDLACGMNLMNIC